ncbi:MAG: hypothetical protein DMG54_22595, partial [Acidobacteria bacterium]
FINASQILTNLDLLLATFLMEILVSQRFSHFEREVRLSGKVCDVYSGLKNCEHVEQSFSAKLQKSHKGGWTYVVWQNSVKFLGTRGLKLAKNGNERLYEKGCVTCALYS